MIMGWPLCSDKGFNPALFVRPADRGGFGLLGGMQHLAPEAFCTFNRLIRNSRYVKDDRVLVSMCVRGTTDKDKAGQPCPLAALRDVGYGVISAGGSLA